MKSRVLSFGCLATSLARNQAQRVIDALQDAAPRLTCQLNLLPSPVPAEAKADESFLTACRAEVDFLAGAIRREEIRLVVLEASDMAAPLPEDLAVLCVPDRVTPFDAFLNRQGLIMDEMEPGSRIGVLSLRSRAQMQRLWPGLGFQVLRGGAEHAMEVHMRRSEIDGLVMPAAVTELLGIQGIVAEIFAPDFVLPGPGQGIQVIAGHAGDHEARDLLADLHSAASAAELAAEHGFYRRMVSDQDLPIGALARVKGETISITGTTGSGTNRVTVHGKLDEAEAAGTALATRILNTVESFADLLEADFPDGLPEDDGFENNEAPEDPDGDLDEIERLRDLENLAGITDKPEDDSDDEPYEP